MSQAIDKPRKIVFLTATRADYGKLKPLISISQADQRFEVSIFVTGMHMLEKFGHTHFEFDRHGFKNIYRFVNQNVSDDMDQILAKTISGFGDYIKEYKPELIVIHGDRVEPLAGAIVGSLNNILTAHIEGGEVSGTIDESIRHAITKLSHIHFCSNQRAKDRLIQLGEATDSIYIIGSPDLDAMKPGKMPPMRVVKKHYDIKFKKYSVLLFHSVTTDLVNLEHQSKIVCEAVLNSGLNYVVIYPNNDRGSEIILNHYLTLLNRDRFVVVPSMRFEYFLSMLKSSDFIIGNSSAGIIEAPYFGVPSVNLGSRQHNRSSHSLIENVEIDPQAIDRAIKQVMQPRTSKKSSQFGNGDSAIKFRDVLVQSDIWRVSMQKYFVDSSPKV